MAMTQKKTKEAPSKRPATSSRVKDRRGLNIHTVSQPTEAWHLARLNALREITEGLNKAIAASVKDPSNTTLEKLVNWAESESQQAWVSFLDASCENKFEHDCFLELGQPDFIELDDEDRGGVVTAMWKATGKQNDQWGIFEVLAERDRTNQPMLMATPFRAVQIDALPEGKVLLPLHDRQISATFMIHEALDTVFFNIKKHGEGLHADQLWQRMVRQAGWYSELVQKTVRALPADEYLSWTKEEVQELELKDAARWIAEKAATGRAQRVLALEAVTRYFAGLIARCEKDMSDVGEPEWLEAAVTELYDALTGAAKACDGYEKALLAWENISTVDKTVMRIFQPIPDDVPMLAILPAQTAAEPAQLRTSNH